jgi:uncharacterized protein YjeT (DUF2065 family)
MKIIIALFGVLICLAGLFILLAPQKFKNLMNSFAGQKRFLFAIIIRIVLGAILLAEATNLKFPFAMKIIGAISIVAAIGILLIGRGRLDRIIDYWMRKPDNFLRSWSVFAIVFGAFFIYVTL